MVLCVFLELPTSYYDVNMKIISQIIFRADFVSFNAIQFHAQAMFRLYLFGFILQKFYCFIYAIDQQKI